MIQMDTTLILKAMMSLEDIMMIVGYINPVKMRNIFIDKLYTANKTMKRKRNLMNLRSISKMNW
jgi:hypothetical protein